MHKIIDLSICFGLKKSKLTKKTEPEQNVRTFSAQKNSLFVQYCLVTVAVSYITTRHNNTFKEGCPPLRIHRLVSIPLIPEAFKKEMDIIKLIAKSPEYTTHPCVQNLLDRTQFVHLSTTCQFAHNSRIRGQFAHTCTTYSFVHNSYICARLISTCAACCLRYTHLCIFAPTRPC
jgi:hypothetical protein